jgi:diaminohydroxyphosphoribosylaminopyrimidine deaminase/5-amino-6-(5-phosphoribosylamino)uracil reductase
LPLVTAKAAMSLDGKIATRTGDSKWITDAAARRRAHELRARSDAIMVGANTVLRDNPRLTLRHGVRGRQPWRVVVDARGRCPRTARLFTDSLRDRTVVLCTRRSSLRWRRQLALRGVTVVVVPERGGTMDLRMALGELGRMEITSVLVEGGGTLHGALFDARLVDRVAFFYAPMVIGGAEAVPVVGGVGVGKVARAVRVKAEPMFVEAEVAR